MDHSWFNAMKYKSFLLNNNISEFDYLSFDKRKALNKQWIFESIKLFIHYTLEFLRVNQSTESVYHCICLSLHKFLVGWRKKKKKKKKTLVSTIILKVKKQQSVPRYTSYNFGVKNWEVFLI